VNFKFKVVQHIQEHGNRDAGRKFDVDEMNVRQRSGEKQKTEGISKKINVHCITKGAGMHMWIPDYINML
jgi:hypothetical protein